MTDQSVQPAIENWHLHITGRVQGVSFRAYARREAIRLGLAGSAANLGDGSVEIVVEGPPAALCSFHTWCQSGSPRAHVEGVKVVSAPVTGMVGFSIS
jgi:acylphosphatase